MSSPSLSSWVGMHFVGFLLTSFVYLWTRFLSVPLDLTGSRSTASVNIFSMTLLALAGKLTEVVVHFSSVSVSLGT